MRILLYLSLTTVFACSNEPASNEPCTDTTGLINGEVVIDYAWSDNEPTPAPNASVTANSSDGENLTIATDDQGFFSVPLPVGSWTFSSWNAEGDCFSEEDITVEVEACGTHTATIRISECYG